MLKTVVWVAMGDPLSVTTSTSCHAEDSLLNEQLWKNSFCCVFVCLYLFRTNLQLTAFLLSLFFFTIFPFSYHFSALFVNMFAILFILPTKLLLSYNCVLLGRDVVLPGNSFPTFRGNVVASSSVDEMAVFLYAVLAAIDQLTKWLDCSMDDRNTISGRTSLLSEASTPASHWMCVWGSLHGCEVTKL
jgi:hypothetical protein